MILSISFGYLYDFEKLYTNNEMLQQVIERQTGIKWKLKDSSYKSDIERLLNAQKIKYEIE